jgi:metal transporter CNNM
LTYDETTIIAGALELTSKTASQAMTPIEDVFALDVNSKLDLAMMQMIMAKGHSRIPVYAGSVTNIVGLVLVKNLLTLLPQDETPVRNCTIRKIPRVAEGVPLYDILNDFQKGHSHMAVVVKCNKEKVESVKQNSEQLKADERQPPKNFESKSTKSIGSDLALPLSYLWTEMSLALHFLNCCL